MSNYKSVIQDYLSNLEKFLKTGDAKEHTYRPAFQHLIENLTEDIQVINEPAYTGGNAPDFLFKKGDTPIAYAECKDIDIDISKKEVQDQAKRYVDAFGKILLTNYIDLEIIDENGSVVKIAIAELDNNKNLEIFEDKFEAFADIIRDYMTTTPQTIKSAKKLAKIMANKAKILRDNARASLDQNEQSDIFKQYRTFQEVLIRDLSKEEFADMYAQTLVYGLFVARYYDPTLKTFSRYEAQDLLPATNPLLKKFFGHVAGTDYDQKIAWIVDSLIETYLATDVAGIMHKEFVKKSKDPVLHFYETFLTEYDKGLRKSRGVYYTPEPVVSFIVRSVDQILKSKFGLVKGLADTSKIPHIKKIQATDGRTTDNIKQITDDIHKVQILDPAVGTGTFLNEVIHEIHKNFVGQEGMWSGYVKEHLLPRLHGFELMMASYTMAHLKLGVTLAELGYNGDERLSVWLTNSLEQGVHEVPNLFMSEWLTEESNKASYIKSDLPIMVVIGNPPYSGVSSNNSKEATRLADKYKIEPGGKQKLQERKHWLNDDYVKFISFAEDQIEKTGEGIVSFITPHGYIDNPTFRGMRWHLLKTFDEIYIVDLHGNSLKKESAPDGGKDENVFNIQQGVSIIFGIKKKESENELANVYHLDIYGKREEKYKILSELNFENVKWDNVKYQHPQYTFLSRDYKLKDEYEKSF
ncbi:MAG: DNA methyltransferase, partial [Candidatus Magasanikbacteria bacterium CG_4_10_14_0_2_um_filter_33_14]